MDVRKMKRKSAIQPAPGEFIGTPHEEARYQIHVDMSQMEGKPPMNKADFLLRDRTMNWRRQNSVR